MKKSLFILMAFVLSMCMPAMADNDRVITFDQLPAQAQELLKKHFAEKVPLIITVDWDDTNFLFKFETDGSLTAQQALDIALDVLSKEAKDFAEQIEAL